MMESDAQAINPMDPWVHFHIFQIFNWSHLRARDIDGHGSELDFDHKDPSEPSPSCEPDKLQYEVMLEDLVHMESMISQIQGYSFDHEKSQWTEDEFDSFLNPPQELWSLDDPQLHLSFQIYLSLSTHSSEATYNMIHSSIKACYPASTMLLFDQVQSQLKRITGILPLYFDMCANTCLAYMYWPLCPPHCMSFLWRMLIWATSWHCDERDSHG